MEENIKLERRDFLIPVKSYLDFCDRVEARYGTHYINRLPVPVFNKVHMLAAYHGACVAAAAIGTIAGLVKLLN